MCGRPSFGTGNLIVRMTSNESTGKSRINGLKQIGVVTASEAPISDYSSEIGATKYSSGSVNSADTGDWYAPKLHWHSAMDNGTIRPREAHGLLFRWVGYHAPATSVVRHD